MKIDKAAMREVIYQAIGKDTAKPKLKEITVFDKVLLETDLRAAIIAWSFRLTEERDIITGIEAVCDFAERLDHTMREETKDIDKPLSQMVRGLKMRKRNG
jgi:hypothetical protein